MMNAFDDPGSRVDLGNAAAQFSCIPIAFSNENRAGPRQMRRRFAERPARQQQFVPKRLLTINQNDILPPAAKFPVLESVIEQEGIAPEFFDGIAAAFHSVF